MAKPVELPRWISDAKKADATVDSAPTEGKKDIGFANSEHPAPQFINWFQRLNYEWANWLDRVDQGLETFANLKSPRLISTVAGAYHANRQRPIAASMFQPFQDAAPWVWAAGGLYWAAGAGSTTAALIGTLPLDTGDVLRRLEINVKDLGGADRVHVALWSIPFASAIPVQIGSTQDSTGTGSIETIEIEDIDSAVAGAYQLLITADSAGANFYNGNMTFDRPAP